MKVTIRGFADGAKIFEDQLDVPEQALEALLPELAEKHARALADSELHMIEIEFPDDPGPDRFFRFGTDPDGMMIPILILGEDNKGNVD